MSAKWIAIALVTSPQGIRGEVRVKPLTDFPERLESTEKVSVKIEGRRAEYEVERARPHGRGMYVMKLRGIDDRNAAEGLRGVQLEVSEDEVVPLPDGTYYVFDLVGSIVYDVDGNRLGSLTDVITTAGNDVYVVEFDDGSEILFPAVKHVVKRVDISSGTIVVDPPPGLLEIYRG